MTFGKLQAAHFLFHSRSQHSFLDKSKIVPSPQSTLIFDARSQGVNLSCLKCQNSRKEVALTVRVESHQRRSNLINNIIKTKKYNPQFFSRQLAEQLLKLNIKTCKSVICRTLKFKAVIMNETIQFLALIANLQQCRSSDLLHFL